MIDISPYIKKLELLRQYIHLRIDGRIPTCQHEKKISERSSVFYNAPMTFRQVLREEPIRCVTPTGHVWENGEWIK